MEGTPDALASPEDAWFDALSEELISCGAVAAFHQSESVRTDSEFISSESSSATEPEIVPNIEPVVTLPISSESSSSIEPEIVRIEPVVAFSFPESSSSSSSSSSRESETVRTDWHTALERRNCKMLLSLLRQAPIDTLWSDPNDRTVLHVAVIQGCLQLVNEVLHLYVTFPNLKPTRDSLLHAKDKSLCGADALKLATVVGNQNILKTIKRALSANPGLPTDIDSEEEFPDAKKNEELYCLIKQKFLEQDAGTRSRLNTNFKDDVDYNFVQNRHELLFLHVACKHSELSDFLSAVLRETTERGNHLLQALSELKDTQGRTLLHVAVEEHGFGDAERDTTMADIVGVLLDFLGEVPQAGRYDNRVNALDSAGRTPLHRAVANGRAGSKVIQALVDHSGTDVNARWGSENDRVTGEPTALHLAVFHNNVDAAQFLLGKEETDADLKCRLFIEASGIWYSNKCKLAKEKWTALEFATIMGHAHIVRLLLEVYHSYIQTVFLQSQILEYSLSS
jgi:ankyrin repeat protein